MPLEREVVHWTKNEFSFAVHISHSAVIREIGYISSFWRIVKREEEEKLKKINVMAHMALMIALEIICTRFLAIETPIIRIGFGFIPVAMAGVMFGPLLGGSVGVLADILGMIIFPKGAYFPGFTLSAFVGAAIYGFFFYNKEVSLKRVILAVGIITLVVNLTMNTIWLTIITGKAAKALLIPRFIKEVTMFPIHTVLIYTVWRLIDKFDFISRPIIKSSK